MLLVGHNPDFEEVLQVYTKNNTHLLSTTSLAILNFNVKNWAEVSSENCQLVNLISPATLSVKATK